MSTNVSNTDATTVIATFAAITVTTRVLQNLGSVIGLSNWTSIWYFSGFWMPSGSSATFSTPRVPCRHRHNSATSKDDGDVHQEVNLNSQPSVSSCY